MLHSYGYGNVLNDSASGYRFVNARICNYSGVRSKSKLPVDWLWYPDTTNLRQWYYSIMPTVVAAAKRANTQIEAVKLDLSLGFIALRNLKL